MPDASPRRPGLFRWILGVTTGALSFIYLIFILNPIQMASVLIYPFSKEAFRQVNRWCARSIWGLWVIMGEVQNDIEVRFVGESVPLRENAVVICNHQSMADTMVLMCFAWRCGRLGDMKWFVKDIIKYFPGFGWGMKFLDCVFVKRDWARDRGGIERIFSRYKRLNIPVFLVSFLEGTRRTPAKLAKAQAFAKERGKRVPQHTLVPRTKGFVATMHGLRGHVDAVYDLTIGYETEPPPSLVNLYEAKVKKIEILVHRYAVDELPEDDDELSDWVFERYEEKDAAMAKFMAEGAFGPKLAFGPIRARDWLVSERHVDARMSPPPA